MARSPTAFVPEARALASAPTGYEASQVPRCLPCTVSGKAAKLRVECAQDDEARQLRVQGALGEAAPSGDESAAGERTNAVLDAAASAALRAGLEGVEGIDGDGYTLAVCGETTWALDRDAAGSEGGGNGSIALLQVANDPVRCTFECHRGTMGSLSHDPCGKSVEVSVREAPGCDKLREGVDVADKAPALRKAVLERCKSAASTCNSVHAVLKSVAGNGEDDSDPTAPRAGGVRAVRASAKTKGPNVCKFECRAKGRIYGSSPYGVTVKVAASAVPGCTGFLKEAGVGPAEGQAAVKAQCAVAAAEAGATCNADYSTFLRAVTQDDAPEPVPRSCTFHCHAAAGWAPFSKPTPCGKHVTFSEASAPGCSSLEAGAHVPTHMTWLSEVTSACQNANGTCTEKSVATVASLQSLSGDAAEEAEGDGSGAGECLLACEHKPVVGFAKSCGVTVAVPERMAPGCTATKFGERIKSDAVGRLCKAHAPESESCDRPRGRFIGMSDAPAPELMGGVVCVGKGGQTSCVKYVADYAPLPTMVDDGQAQVVARPLQPNEPVAGGFLYAFDKLTASIVYGEKAHADYRIKDTCPAVPAPNSET